MALQPNYRYNRLQSGNGDSSKSRSMGSLQQQLEVNGLLQQLNESTSNHELKQQPSREWRRRGAEVQDAQLVSKLLQQLGQDDEYSSSGEIKNFRRPNSETEMNSILGSMKGDLYAEMGEFVSVSGGAEATLTESQYASASDILLKRTKSVGQLVAGTSTSERVKSCKSLKDLAASLKSEEDAQKGWTQRVSALLRKDMGHQTFTEQQKKTLNTFSSLSYTPTHSIAYVNWITEQKSRLYHRMEWDRWFLVFLIGVSIGLVAALLKQCIQALSNEQWKVTKSYLQDDNLVAGFFFQAGLNTAFVLVGSFLVTFIHPPAVGGGTPEVLAYLNGIIVHGTLSLKNLIVKFCGNVLAVAGGLPSATQAPIITYGAIIGSGVGQFQSKHLGFRPNVFTRFRNPEDRRGFTTNGVAAGVSAGFNSPIGGLLFAMEDLSSFWSKGLSWQTFFCCGVATAVAQMFNTAFTGFIYKGSFGGFNVNLVEPIQMHVATLLPAVILGLIGGLLGAFFTRLNTFISLHRRKFYAKIKNLNLQRSLKVLEPIIVAILMTVFTVFLPLGFSCQPVLPSYEYSLYSTCNFTGAQTTYKRPFGLNFYDCTVNGTETQQLYNPMATLIQGSGTAYLDKLWSRGTYFLFDWDVCLAAFVIYFFGTIYTAGTAVAGGIFVPLLICGSLLGRSLGVGFIYMWQALDSRVYPVPPWMWLDPGVIAAIGAAALLSGVNRLAVASTAIVVEMVGDIFILIPILAAIFVSKMTADQLSKPLHKCMLDSKALPFLEQNPEVYVKGRRLNMELSRASDVMTPNVEVIHIKEMVAFLAYLLLNTTHGAFPVVKYDNETKTELAYGLITRNRMTQDGILMQLVILSKWQSDKFWIELYTILNSEEVYERQEPGVITPDIPAEELSVDYIANPKAVEERIKTYMKFDKVYSNIFIDLDRYINMSMPKIDQDYSLYRTYLLFRTLGLRHLVVIDVHNTVVGIITRKNLMQFNMEERMEKLIGKKDDDDDDDEKKIIDGVNSNNSDESNKGDKTTSQITDERPQGMYSRNTKVFTMPDEIDQDLNAPVSTVSSTVLEVNSQVMPGVDVRQRQSNPNDGVNNTNGSVLNGKVTQL